LLLGTTFCGLKKTPTEEGSTTKQQTNSKAQRKFGITVTVHFITSDQLTKASKNVEKMMVKASVLGDKRTTNTT